MTVQLTGGRQLSREAIVAAAIDMIESSGVEALSMRSLARHCGAAPMSLYRHVATKEDLLTAVADHYLSEVKLPDTDGLTWEETVKQVILAVDEGFETHTHLADILVVHPIDPAAILKATEAVARALRTAGFDDDDVVSSLALLAAYATGYAQRRIGHRRTAAARKRRLADLGQLEASEFATLLSLGDRVAALDTPEHFEAGLDTIIDGLRRHSTDISAEWPQSR